VELKPVDVRTFVDLVRIDTRMLVRFGVPLKLIVVDTIAATFALEDENDSAQATRAMKTLQRIAEQTESCVVGIAHYGKNAEVGVRGSSSFTASADVILAATWKRTATGQVTQRTLSLDKSRRAETGWAAEFFLMQTSIGEDEDGEEISSCYVIGARGRHPSLQTTIRNPEVGRSRRLPPFILMPWKLPLPRAA
jgi:hypothetical protein